MGVLTDDVLSQMLRRLLAYRIHHTINMLSLAGYLQSPVFDETAAPFPTFMEPALDCSLGLSSLPVTHDARYNALPLPGSLHQNGSWLHLPHTAPTGQYRWV
jgi:hypothetical protein